MPDEDPLNGISAQGSALRTGGPAEVLVLGGGLAGAAAALQLARAGRRVTLLEREREARDKVCGEFLSTEALGLLRGLGLHAEALGATPITGVRLCDARRTAEIPLPFPAMSLRRRHLDAALLAAAAQAGAEIVQGAAIEALERIDRLWLAKLSEDREREAPRAILATGKHDLRGFSRPPGPQNDLVALKMYLRLHPAQTAALAGNVELLLYPGGYAGLQLVEDAANLACLVTRHTLARLGGWDGLLEAIMTSSAHARKRLTGAEPLLPKPLAVASLPYGFVREHAPGEDLWAVGDQAAVIPSFTGDGMSIALYTGLRAAQGILRGESSEACQQSLQRDLRGQVCRATWISQALLRPASGAVITRVVRQWPALMRQTARWTRISPGALERLG